MREHKFWPRVHGPIAHSCALEHPLLQYLETPETPLIFVIPSLLSAFLCVCPVVSLVFCLCLLINMVATVR